MTWQQAIIWNNDGQFTDAYMRHLDLVGAKPLSEPMLEYWYLGPKE